MARFYANEYFPWPVIAELRQREHDVLTTGETGKAGRAIPDPEVLQFAIADQRTILTQNRRDFIRLHSVRPDHFGIVVCTHDPDVSALAERIHTVVSAESSLTGKLIRITRTSS